MPEASGAGISRFARILCCIAAGVLFVLCLGRLWPLAQIDLVADPRLLAQQAQTFLESRGFDLDGYRTAASLTVDGRGLEHLERSLGRQVAQQRIRDGAPLFRYKVWLKRQGEPSYYVVQLHPSAGVLGWYRHVEEDMPGERLDVGEARALARDALQRALGLAVGEFEERSASSTERPERRDHSFWFERTVNEEPELRERVRVQIVGNRVSGAQRSIVVPGVARRAARAAEAPGRALEICGSLLLAVGAIGAFFIFLARLRDGEVDLKRTAVWPAAVFCCLLVTQGLQRTDLFAAWEPLWPRWVSTLRFFVFRATEQIWIVLLLLAVVGAGYALDRASGGKRGLALERLGRGKLLDPLVAAASGRGFLVGMLCGGVMAGSVLLLEGFFEARTAIQPRGFFFYPLNAASPALASLLFFFGVALAEELGYRFFLGGWLLALTHRRWVAVLLPALIYGLTHTRLGFLPPAEPFWARPLVLALVGCVWGWAFLRYDALTVVLSHLTADLFIFNWPRLASGEPGPVLTSLSIIAVPLLPAALSGLRLLRAKLEVRAAGGA